MDINRLFCKPTTGVSVFLIANPIKSAFASLKSLFAPQLTLAPTLA